MSPFVEKRYKRLLRRSFQNNADWSTAKKVVRRHADYEREIELDDAPTPDQIDEFLDSRKDWYDMQRASRNNGVGSKAESEAAAK